MEKLEHTKGPWKTDITTEICMGQEIVRRKLFYESDYGPAEVPFNSTSQSENTVMGNTTLRELATATPHFCADPQCPGDINRRKLQAAEEMAKALHHIAWEPLGHAEANHREALDIATRIAQAALQSWERAGRGEK